MPKQFKDLNEKEKKRLLAKALSLIAAWKPLPEELGKRLGPVVLKRLLDVVKRIRQQGLAGPMHRPPERLRAMKRILESMLQESDRPQDPADVLPEPARSAQLGEESLLQRQADAQESRTYKRELRNRRTGRSLM